MGVYISPLSSVDYFLIVTVDHAHIPRLGHSDHSATLVRRLRTVRSLQ